MTEAVSKDSAFDSAKLDCGAEISIAPYDFITSLGLDIIALSQPLNIIFANNSRTQAHHCSNLGSLGVIYLIKNAPDVLLSVNSLTKTGFQILLTNTKLTIFNNMGQHIYTQTKQPSAALWPINIPNAMNACQTSNTSNTICQPCHVVNAARVHKRIPASTVQLVHDLHQIWQHPSASVMARAVSPFNPFPPTSPLAQITPQVIITVLQHRPCLACLVAKTNRLPQQLGSGVLNNAGAIWSLDCIGPILPPTVYGATKMYLFVEQRYSFKRRFLVRDDNTITLELALKDILAFNTQHHLHMVALRFDAGSVTNSRLFSQILSVHNIASQPAAPDEQQQDPAERHVQTLYKAMAANNVNQLLLGPQYWGHNSDAVLKASNKLPNTKCPHSSPYKELTGKDPDFSTRQFKFGQPGIASIVGPTTATPFDKCLRQRRQQDANNELVIAIGQPEHGPTQSVLVVIPHRRDLLPVTRYHFTPIPTQLPDLNTEDFEQLNTTDEEELNFVFKSRDPSNLPLDSSYIATIHPHDHVQHHKQQQPFADITPTADLHLQRKHHQADSDEINSDETYFSHNHTSAQQTQHRRHRSGHVSAAHVQHGRRQHISFEERRYIQFLASTQPYVSGVRRQRTDDHPLFSTVFKHSLPLWQPAIDKEFKTIDDLGVKETIKKEQIPKWVQILQLMLDLKIKRLSTGEIEKLKARLLADGSKEWPSDEELFSPTASKETILFLIALGVLLGLQIHEMDITGAFLYSFLDEPVYCRLPTQFRDENGDFVYWKLRKSLYGMRRSPRRFFDTMVNTLIRGNYKQSVFDRCCFHLTQGPDLFIVAFWVDNMYYFATNNRLIVDFEKFMAENFKITKNDEAEHILGMHSQSNSDGSKTMLMPAILDKLVFECF